MTNFSGAAAETATTPDAIRRMGESTPAPEIFNNAADSRPQPPGEVGARQIEERNRRFSILETFWAIIERGVSRTEACVQMGQSYTTVWRYEEYFNEGGKDGLIPKTGDCGRKSQWEMIIQDADFCQKLTTLYLATIGGSSGSAVARAARTGRRTAKMATALTAMAEEPECPPELAARLKRGRFPICLQRYLRRITPELENRIRGPKHSLLNGLVSRRDLTLRFPNGDRADMPAGFKWVFDDMSANQPFWCSVDRQILFSRQGLYAVDHRSLRWLGKLLVARPREAYRAEDILRFLRKLFGLYGKPDVIVFEQGIWKARKITGWKITPEGAVVEDEIVRPEMDDVERENITHGLQAIGCKIIFATSAHGKIIETCFNHLQDVLAMKTPQFVNIGRHAGEFEIPGKRLAQVRAGSRQPQALGFAAMHELSDAIDAAFAHINGKTNSRGETPDEIWAKDMAARPLLPLERADYASFFTDMRERRIAGGRVTVKIGDRWLDFRADWMAQLGSGFKVFIKFDPSEPTLGAAIYNRQTGASNARINDPARGYRLGEFLGFAAWEMPAPSVDVITARGIEPQPLEDFYGVAAVDQGDDIRRAQNKLVATAFSALPRPGQPAVKTTEARDGAGRVTRVDLEQPVLDRAAKTVQADCNQRVEAHRRMIFEADDALAALPD